MSRKKGTPKIEVKMDVQDGDIPEMKNPTYKRIQEYVMEKYGVHVHSRYIGEVKRMCGIEVGKNYNKSKKEEPDVKHCPQKKVEFIKEALKHFNVILSNCTNSRDFSWEVYGNSMSAQKQKTAY